MNHAVFCVTPRHAPFHRSLSVFAINYLPDCWKLFVQSKRRVFEDRSDFNRELAAPVFLATFPSSLIAEEMDLIAADWTLDHAIRSADERHQLEAHIRVFKVSDRLQQPGPRFHALRAVGRDGLVN
jgi:hypothetical protein